MDFKNNIHLNFWFLIYIKIQIYGGYAKHKYAKY